MRISLKVKAYAKVNLILQVLSKRSDGFHNVNTVLQNINLADTLIFKEAPDLALESNINIPAEDNLIIKAARLLQRHTKTSKGASIFLEKNIPIEAGLGGGSADAGATLIALNNLWQLNLERKELYELGASLGADVNFFLSGGLALAGGRGEVIQPLEKDLDMNMVIAKPDFGITAKKAYYEWDKQPEKEAADLNYVVEKLKKGKFAAADLFNDLEASVLAFYPQMKQWFSAGYRAGASKVMLSGSGSAFFAIAGEKAQDNVYAAWQKEGLAVFKVKTVNRSVEINEG